MIVYHKVFYFLKDFYYGFKERNARRPEESLKLRKKNIVLLICCYETCRN